MVAPRGYRKEDFSQKAQSLIEFALVLPLLLVLIVSAIELGRLFYTQIVITNAAREGAYYMATHVEDTAAAANATLAAQAEAANSGINTVTVSFADKNCCTFGSYSIVTTVDTTVDNLMIVGFAANVFSITTTHHSQFPLSASVEMMVQP